MAVNGGRAMTLQATPEVASPIASSGSCESVQEIMNIAATGEAFAVTFLGQALASAESGDLPLNAELAGTLTAARAAEQAHYDVLTEAGAEATTLEFTFPDSDVFTNVGLFLETVVRLEEASIAAYLAAAQEFSILGEPTMAQLALQIGAVEAEHRVGARYFAIQAGELTGTPNDVAFEKALFTRVGEVATLLEELGFIGGDGETVSFPGPGEINTTGVTNLEP